MESVLLIAVLLACPVGMGLMMWFMARSPKKPAAGDRSVSVAELRSEQQRLETAISDAEARTESAGGGRR